MITCSIDTSKIDKSKLYTSAKGTVYLDLVLIEKRNDQYDQDYMVVQGVNKADRAAGVKGAILGNGKIIKHAQSSHTAKPAPAAAPAPEEEPDSLPF